MTRRILGLLLILILAISGCTAAPAQTPGGEKPTSGAALRDVTLGVGFVPNVQFAPLYVGIAKGFFADEGINLQLEYGFENDYLKLVGLDNLQFMIGSGDQVILGRAQELPVRYIMNWYVKYPVVVFAKADRNLTQPSDLKGLRIGLPGLFGANYVALRGILEAGGLTENDVTLDSIGFTQAAAVSQGSVDAAVDYAVNGPVVLGQEGIATRQITLDNYLSLPANGLVTNDKTIAEEPELAAGMVRALQKSVQYTIDHPDEAFWIALQTVPEAGGENEAANRAVFDASLAYWTPPAGAKLGETTEQAWQAAAEFMQRTGLVDRPVAVESLYTNEFLP